MENSVSDGILEEIASLSSRAETGRLRITTGMTEGALFFRNGKLVDACLGGLTGFNAINAVASISDSSFTFNPAIAPPTHSSLTPSERILIKDFFGIETVEPEQPNDPEGESWPNDNFPAQRVVALTESDESLTTIPEQATEPKLAETTPSLVTSDESLNAADAKETAPFPDEGMQMSDKDDEVTLLRSKEPRAKHPRFLSYEPRSMVSYRTALIIAALVMLVAGVGVVLISKLRDRSLPGSTAATVETASPANVEQVPNSNAVASTAPDLSGNWSVVNTVEQTSYEAFKNLKVGFNLSIAQDGNGFTGKGEKVSENGRSLPASGRTPIVVNGSIDGDRVEATFFEEGAVRKTQGRFVWRIEKAGTGLTGTFVSTAARASGKSAATKDL